MEQKFFYESSIKTMQLKLSIPTIIGCAKMEFSYSYTILLESF